MVKVAAILDRQTQRPWGLGWSQDQGHSRPSSTAPISRPKLKPGHQALVFRSCRLRGTIGSGDDNAGYGHSRRKPRFLPAFSIVIGEKA